LSIFDFSALIEPSTGQPADGAPIGALLTAHATVTPNAPALTIGGETLTFAQLDATANCRARLLASEGIKHDDVVLVALPNCVEYYATCFAIWKLGATPCHVSADLTDPEFNAIIELANPALVILRFVDRFPDVRVLKATPDDEANLSSKPLPPLTSSCFRIATSGGSTGRPKLIVDPMPSVWGPDKETVRRPPRSVLMNPAPLYHSAPFALMQLGLCQGSHVIDMQRFGASNWLLAAERHKIEWAYLVPTMMSRIAKLPAEQTAAADLTALRTILHMAAPCPVSVKRWWIERIGPEAVWEVYGGTERIGATTIGGTEWLAHPGSVGTARPGQEIVILGEDSTPLPRGQIGEIYFRKEGGPGSTYRYIGAGARISGDVESFGDMGWLDADGYLFLADRRTDMILSGGVNIYPAEIEAVVETLPGVIVCAVIGLPDEDLGQSVHAIVQTIPEFALTGPDIIAALEGRLNRNKHPRSVEIVTDALRNDAGKMRRSALRDARLDGFCASSQKPIDRSAPDVSRHEHSRYAVLDLPQRQSEGRQAAPRTPDAMNQIGRT
jgi:bile acid-coenzyme A ligase